MTAEDQVVGAYDARAERRTGRRAIFEAVLGASVIGAGLALAGSAEAQTVTDGDILNFALNLEYLEANFYYYAAFGTPIPAGSINGVGTAVPAATATDANGNLLNAGARQVQFTNGSIGNYAREVAADELNHVNFLRTAIGGTAVAQPTVDIGITPNGAFSTAARAAGFIGATTVAAPTFFDPYANELNFLYGAYIFEDVGVSAYRGASGLLTNKTYIDAAAGILAVEAYHAAIVRTTLDSAFGANPGLKASTVRGDTQLISAVRDAVDGPTSDDIGILQKTNTVGTVASIVPTDSNGLVYGRTTGQVLNIVYLNSPPTKTGATKGGFFPNGMNGNIKTSTPNG